MLFISNLHDKLKGCLKQILLPVSCHYHQTAQESPQSRVRAQQCHQTLSISPQHLMHTYAGSSVQFSQTIC